MHGHSNPQCGNPILLSFLEKWDRQAQESDNIHARRVYRVACESMRNCPVAFDHPSQAECLKGIGPKIAQRLASELTAYRLQRGEEPPQLQQPLSVSTNENQHPKATSSTTRKRKAPAKTSNALATISANIAGSEVIGGDEDGDVDIGGAEEAAPTAPKKKRRQAQPKAYVPRPRSGAYAIIRALVELDDESAALTKEELIRVAQPYCDSSFTVSSNVGNASLNGTTAKYTAWSTMKTLKDKDLVMQRGRPARFCLTDLGRETGELILQVEAGMDEEEDDVPPLPAPTRRKGKSKAKKASEEDEEEDEPSNQPDITSKSGSEVGRLLQSRVQPAVLPGSTSNLSRLSAEPSRARGRSASAAPAESNPDIYQSFPLKYLKAGAFQIQLVLDNREVAMKSDREYMQRQLSEIDCTPITRGMELGDAMWVARGKLYNGAGEELDEEVEVSLDHVCERKRIDDLVFSIKDGRFHEQKFRLGKLINNVTYIVETTNNLQQSHSMADAIQTAIFSTQVVNGFFVKLSPKIDETIRYLARYTRLLEKAFSSKNLYVIPPHMVVPRSFSELRKHLGNKHPGKEFVLTYSSLASLASKSRTMTIRDVFLKMLMCTKGVSAEKALEIQREFKTPAGLCEAMMRCTNQEEAKRLVADRVDRKAKVERRKIKTALSSKLWDVWGQS